MVDSGYDFGRNTSWPVLKGNYAGIHPEGRTKTKNYLKSV